MKVAVDYSWLGATGIGRMASEVIRRKPDQVEVIGIREGRSNARPYTPLSLSLGMRAAKPEAFWSPGFMPPLTTSGIPSAITVHDLTHLHFYGAKHRLYYKAVILPLLRQVDVIFTVSDYTKQELHECSGISDDRVIRIYNGVDPVFTSEGDAFDIGRPYILYSGNRRKYKNVKNLMAAFARSTLARSGFMLGLTGMRDEECEELETAFGIAGDVHYFGFVPEADLPSLYRGAHALAFVSLYEGFGLPIIEAMGCGTPVLTSLTSSMPEVAGGAALLVNPNSVDDIGAGLAKICLDEGLRDALRQRGLVRAASFSWDDAAKDYWKAIGNLKPS
jgi:glycosyltransferase involved in cell wall biosynthesis